MIERDGKQTKLPINPSTGSNAKSNDPSTWGSFDKAVSYYNAQLNSNKQKCDGIGFMFTLNESFVGVDLDHCISESGKLDTSIRNIVNTLNSYTEISPSGRGLHIITKGKLPPGGRKKGNVELYESGRYFTITGNIFRGCNKHVENRQNEIDEIHAEIWGTNAKTKHTNSVSGRPKGDPHELLTTSFHFTNGSKNEQLWNGDFSGYPSQSEADLAFCSHLAWLFQKDASLIDSIFRKSGLYRDKWDVTHSADGSTYGQMTIKKAISSTDKTYNTNQNISSANIVALLNGQARNDYPLLEIKGIKFRYGRDNAKTIIEREAKRKYTGKSDKHSSAYYPVSSLYGIPARLRYIDKSDASGLRINIEGFDGSLKSLDIERSFLVKASGNELKSELLAAGLRIYPDGDKIILATLKAAHPDKEILITTKPGLFQIDNHKNFAFVTPDGKSYSDNNHQVELSPNERITAPYSCGSFEGWKDAIRTATTAPGCPHFALGVMAAFVGPILSIAKLDTCGINLSGFTSKGKSTAQMLAASAWSTPKLGCGLFQSMRTTDNAVELLATKANGTVLLLDDIAHIDGRDLGAMIYTLSSGSSKSRMTQLSTLQSRQTWNTFAIFSGEKSLEEKIKSAGGSWQAGMSVRFPDVDVTDVNEKLTNETMRSINSIAENYGHAGHKFIEAIFNNGLHHKSSELKQTILNAARHLANSEESQLIRAAIPFALIQIAGNFAKEFETAAQSSDVVTEFSRKVSVVCFRRRLADSADLVSP
ncbi:DUF927 domain-containing protein [Desulfovibrio sulfodismutans]|uniref:DUF927 domain-containing protein n=1 Tax=Desulfolutivibrio sulfodismutans TaxID=63561 RepID=A0A7K3NRY8_9BACT|nr:DUF927 domain-containing protein [Desulfolutivibrio sulfodismutans]NDY58958.1 DUF927 domain-containing protein [Desulfolutivibrio sulfodismutans]